MDVVCRKYSCTFNDQAKCLRKHLAVDGQALCASSIIEKDKIVEDVSKDMFEHEPDIAPYHHCKNINIMCETSDCIFNKHGECFSNGIFVGSEIDASPCNSFVPR